MDELLFYCLLVLPLALMSCSAIDDGASIFWFIIGTILVQTERSQTPQTGDGKKRGLLKKLKEFNVYFM